MHQDTTWVPKTNQPRDNLQGSLHTWRFPTRPPCTPTVQGPNRCSLGSSIPPMVQSQHGCHSFLEPSNCWYWCYHSWVNTCVCLWLHWRQRLKQWTWQPLLHGTWALGTWFLKQTQKWCLALFVAPLLPRSLSQMSFKARFIDSKTLDSLRYNMWKGTRTRQHIF